MSLYLLNRGGTAMGSWRMNSGTVVESQTDVGPGTVSF